MNLKTIPKTTGVVFIRKISSGTTPVRLKFQSAKMFRLKAIPFNIHTLLMMKCFLPELSFSPNEKGFRISCFAVPSSEKHPTIPWCRNFPLSLSDIYSWHTTHWTLSELNILNNNPSQNLVYGWLTQKMLPVGGGNKKWNEPWKLFNYHSWFMFSVLPVLQD